jgi:hypothetical protein
MWRRKQSKRDLDASLVLIWNSKQPSDKAYCVSQLVPPGILRFCDRVAFEEQDEGRGRAVVKENEHRPFGRSSE